MKRIYPKIIGLSVLVILVLCSVTPLDDYNKTEYIPILLERTELEKSVQLNDARAIEQPGKIYVIDSFLFVNEKYKGVHVFNNANPQTPVNMGFVRIPGCIDMAVKGNVLYADNAVDLVAIQMTGNEVTVTKRLRGVFSEHTPPDLDWMPDLYNNSSRPVNSIIVEWKKKD